MLARARTHTRACGCTYMFEAWTGEVGPLCLSIPSFLPSHSPPCLSIPPTSLASFAPSPLPARPFFHSFSLSLSFYDPQSALPPTRLVRTIGVSTLETLHAWHTCKRARKSTQYRYRCVDREICPKTCRDSPQLVLKDVEGNVEKIERKIYPSSRVFIDSSWAMATVVVILKAGMLRLIRMASHFQDDDYI